jgi:hypothetical protein
MWELRPNLFIMPAKGGLKMKTIRYMIRGYLTANSSSDIFSKGGRTFFKKEPAEEVFVMNTPEEEPIGRILPDQ